MELVGIIARRKMPENLIKKEQVYRKINKQENSPLLSGKACLKVTEKGIVLGNCYPKLSQNNREFRATIAQNSRLDKTRMSKPQLSDKAC